MAYRKVTQQIPIGKLEQELNTFRENFYKKKNVMQYDSYLVYHKIPNGLSNQILEEANKLILSLKIDLIAKSNKSESGLFQDTIIIQEKL
jgi:hypothetical protein